jgi:hypothetical protein
MKTFWLSFANDGGNLGCIIIDAINDLAAIAVAPSKLHPGGQVIAIEMSQFPGFEEEVEKWGRNRLITPTELLAAQYRPLYDLRDEFPGIELYPSVTMVCEEHAP